MVLASILQSHSKGGWEMWKGSEGKREVNFICHRFMFHPPVLAAGRHFPALYLSQQRCSDAVEVKNIVQHVVLRNLPPFLTTKQLYVASHPVVFVLVEEHRVRKRRKTGLFTSREERCPLATVGAVMHCDAPAVGGRLSLFWRLIRKMFHKLCVCVCVQVSVFVSTLCRALPSIKWWISRWRCCLCKMLAFLRRKPKNVMLFI